MGSYPGAMARQCWRPNMAPNNNERGSLTPKKGVGALFLPLVHHGQVGLKMES
jgi:hypothetical protein